MLMCLLERLKENDFRFSVPHDYCNLSVILDDDWINDVEAMVDLNIGHGLMGVLMHPHYLHSLVFSFTPGSVDLEKAC